MVSQLENLYKVKKQDRTKAGFVLANAFQHDPVWKKVLEGIGTGRIRGFFEGPVRYGLTYGSVYATSENLEGIAAWVPGNHADMTLWRGIRSGSMISGMKLGMKTIMKMKPIFGPLEAERRENMKGRDYIYLMIIGVGPEFQGQGFGKTLLGALVQESDFTGTPLYLETATERNVMMYEKLGFKVLNRMVHPIINVPQWEMVREPERI
jgi:ribosomal protein S18 acetylase RimI-like enzyme